MRRPVYHENKQCFQFASKQPRDWLNTRCFKFEEAFKVSFWICRKSLTTWRHALSQICCLSACWTSFHLNNWQAFWKAMCPHCVCPFLCGMSSLFFGFCFLSLSGLEEDSSAPAPVRRRRKEAEWEQMTAKRGNRGTSSGDGFLSQLLQLRIISSSVGVKGLKWWIAHVFRR